ncbi:MAG TPA: hypothetical protein VIF60_17090 [Burkholderiaceae bacterium]
MVTPVFLQARPQEVDKQGKIVGACRDPGNFLVKFTSIAMLRALTVIEILPRFFPKIQQLRGNRAEHAQLLAKLFK